MPERCDDCPALAEGLCGTLDDAELCALSRIGHKRSLAPGQALLWHDTQADAVANIVSGAVKLTTTSRDGDEQIVGLCQAGDFIGRPFAERAAFSAVALGPVELCLFPRNEFERFLEAQPALALGLLRRTLDDLDRARRLMLLLGRGTAEQRVAALLLSLAPGIGADQRFDLPFGRRQMADLLGLALETVSRQLSRLKRDGVIAFKGRRGVIVHRADQLKALAV